MATEVQFGGDHDAFPLWGRDESGRFDVNMPGLRASLSAELTAELERWAARWAQVDGGDQEDDAAEADGLIAEARSLATRVDAELGPDYRVSVRWDRTS